MYITPCLYITSINMAAVIRDDDDESLYQDARILAGIDEENELRDPCFECIHEYSEMQEFRNIELFRMTANPESRSQWFEDPGRMHGNKYFALVKGYFQRIEEEAMVESSYVGKYLKLLVVTEGAWKENFLHDSGFGTMDDYKTMIETFGSHDGFMVKQMFDNVIAGTGDGWSEAYFEVCIYRPSLRKIHQKRNLEDGSAGGRKKRRRLGLVGAFPNLRL